MMAFAQAFEYLIFKHTVITNVKQGIYSKNKIHIYDLRCSTSSEQNNRGHQRLTDWPTVSQTHNTRIFL